MISTPEYLFYFWIRGDDFFSSWIQGNEYIVDSGRRNEKNSATKNAYSTVLCDTLQLTTHNSLTSYELPQPL